MTVSTGFTRQVYPGNGNTTTFTFGFAFPDTSFIQVFFTDHNGSTTQIPSGNFTLIPNPPIAPNPTPVGGTITYTQPGGPIPLGSFLTVARNLPTIQETSLSNQGTLYQTALEQAYDYNVMLIQQIAEAKMPGIRGPIIGVTDGSLASSGEVGEFLQATATASVAQVVGTQTLTVLVMTLPAGDWDCMASAAADFSFDALIYQLAPVPPGLSGAMAGFLGVFTATPETNAVVNSARVQASIAVPTALPFTIVIINPTAAGTVFLEVTARRMR